MTRADVARLVGGLAVFLAATLLMRPSGAFLDGHVYLRAGARWWAGEALYQESFVAPPWIAGIVAPLSALGDAGPWAWWGGLALASLACLWQVRRESPALVGALAVTLGGAFSVGQLTPLVFPLLYVTVRGGGAGIATPILVLLKGTWALPCATWWVLDAPELRGRVVRGALSVLLLGAAVLVIRVVEPGYFTWLRAAADAQYALGTYNLYVVPLWVTAPLGLGCAALSLRYRPAAWGTVLLSPWMLWYDLLLLLVVFALSLAPPPPTTPTEAPRG